jgi:hypothetical protein
MKSKDLLKLIPNHVRITKDITYEILWTDEFFKDNNKLGECWYDGRQIKINKNQSPTQAFATFIHEVYHAMSFETKGLNLTEPQVQKLEHATMRVLKLNGILEKL